MSCNYRTVLFYLLSFFYSDCLESHSRCRTTLSFLQQIKRPLSSVIFEIPRVVVAVRGNALCWMQNVTVILMCSMFQLFSMLKDGRKSCHARWGHVLRITYPRAQTRNYFIVRSHDQRRHCCRPTPIHCISLPSFSSLKFERV